MIEIKTSQDPEQDFSTKLADVILRVRTHNNNAYKAAEIVANMVREHDQNQNLYIPEIKKKERAKVKAECIEAAKSCRREVYSRAGVHKCYDMDISFNQLIKALEEV